MTSAATVIVLICAIVVLAIAWRVMQLLGDRHADAQALAIQRLAQEREAKERELELKRRELEFRERTAPRVEVPPVSEFPPQMLGYVSNESEEWAREDGITLIGEAYVDAGGDWQKAGALLANRYAVQPRSRLPKELLS